MTTATRTARSDQQPDDPPGAAPSGGPADPAARPSGGGTTAGPGFDFSASYVLPADLQLVQRDASTVQIGTERPRRMLLVNAPAHAPAILASLNGAVTAGDAVARWDGDPLLWRSVLTAMLSAGLLVPAPPPRPRPPHLTGERLVLVHRYGPIVADRILAARSDALVVVDGTGPVAETVTTLLAAAGVGHVHHRPPDDGAGTRAGKGSPAAGSGPLDPAWRAAPSVRVHRPAPQMPPSAVVLAGDTLPDLGRAAELVTALIPHLAVRVTQARAVVGPLVLPGRSACLNCLERHRTEADPGWPAVARRLRAHPVVPATLAAQAAAELAARQTLELIDGRREPSTVGACIERPADGLRVRRRRWQPHPDCGCRLLAGQL